jgi:hypothetical protein
MMRAIKIGAITVSYDNTDKTVAIEIGSREKVASDWISWDQWVDLVHGFCSMAEDADKADDADDAERDE